MAPLEKRFFTSIQNNVLCKLVLTVDPLPDISLTSRGKGFLGSDSAGDQSGMHEQGEEVF